MNWNFAIILIIMLALVLGCKDTPVEERDKKIFLRAGELSEYGFNYAAPEKYEKFTKTYFYDNTYQLEYEFETPEEDKENILYLTESISVENKASDARMSKGTEDTAVKFGLRIGGVEPEEVPDFYHYGDSSNFFVLKKDGKPVGNHFTCRIGSKTYSLMMVGLQVDDPEIWKEMIEGKLAAISSYVP